jgi:short-subunit dehydrogenase
VPLRPAAVVITGASSGIGRALALCYARDGTVLGLLGRSSERLETVAEECRRRGATVATHSIDMRARLEMQKWLERFDDSAPIDLLIANAGLMAGTPPGGTIESTAASHELMDVNVLGTLNTIHPVLPRMMARGHGQIAIISSIAAFIPLPDAPSYSASKAALLTYGLALRSALHKSGIGVSVVCPGYVKTPMSEQETGPQPFSMSADSAAELIVRGLRRNRARIAFPFWFALVTRLGGLLPENLRRRSTARFTVSDRK